MASEFPVPQTDRKSKQVKEYSGTENFIWNQYDETLAILTARYECYVQQQKVTCDKA